MNIRRLEDESILRWIKRGTKDFVSKYSDEPKTIEMNPSNIIELMELKGQLELFNVFGEDVRGVFTMKLCGNDFSKKNILKLR